MNADVPTILIIAETPAVMDAARVSAAILGEVEISALLWKQTTSPLFSPELITNSSLVIVELFRNYQHGIRAEGFVLAERYRDTTPFLIIAPRFWARQIESPGYWDVAADDTLSQRIRRILHHPEMASINIDRLGKKVHKNLSIPRQH